MNILDAILDVFSKVSSWIADAVTDLLPMFYIAPVGETPGSLTILGVLAVASLAISVIFLIIGVIQNFLHFRG